MIRFSNPAGVPVPGSNYSQLCEVPAGATWAVASGQVGVTPDGTLLDGSEAQMRQAWANLIAALAAAGMGPEHIVKVTSFLTDAADVPLSRTIRDEALKGARPTSTLLVVSALASPAMRFEVEATAAKA